MALGNHRAIAGPIRVLFDAGTFRDLTDGQLLERFATARGEVGELAFAALVERHGPMVLRVCRSVLLDPDDSRDAFQATFLVLVEKGRGLWVRDSLGPWLHQVALRTAKYARASAARRRRLERSLPIPEPSTPQSDDLGPILHEEIERLPERYRVPLVLCDLQGRTHEQAARHLGWPVGTVKSRQSRGRDRLRERLRKRGLAPGAGSIFLALRPGGLGSIVPPLLSEETSRIAIRSLAPGGLSAGLPAASLALEVAKTMTMSHWWKLAAAMIVAGATASGVPLLARQDAPGDGAPAAKKAGAKEGAAPVVKAAEPDGPATAIATRGKLRSLVVERGNLEASKVSRGLSEVEGQTTILSIVPDGTNVQSGDLVAELDSTAIKDGLVNQEIATKRARSDLDDAEKTRMIAEIAAREYAEGTAKQDHEALQAAIGTGEAAAAKAKDRLDRTRRAKERFDFEIGKIKSTAQSILAELEMADRMEDAEVGAVKAAAALPVARKKLELFEKFSFPRVVTELEANVAKARSAEMATRATFDLQMAKEAKLRRMIGRCKLYAPTDGLLIYANDSTRPGSPMIEEGSTVRERQMLFTIFDMSAPLRMNVKVHESIVDRVAPGQTVRVVVDALPNLTLTGVVKSIQPLPDARRATDNGTKFYTTLVDLADSPKTLRPGMTAKADITIRDVDDAVTVPLSAVVRLDGNLHVAVKAADGGHEWRTVSWGWADDKSVEIKSGLKGGEAVFIDPKSVMTDAERETYTSAYPVPPGSARPAASPLRLVPGG